MDVDLCASLERWEFPVIDGLRLDVRLSQVRVTSPSAASSSDTCQQRRNVIHESGCLVSSRLLCSALQQQEMLTSNLKPN